MKDIPLLAEHFLKIFARKNGKRSAAFPGRPRKNWFPTPGPEIIKELENVIQRAAIVSSEDMIIPGDLIFVVPSEKEIHKINLSCETKEFGISCVTP